MKINKHRRLTKIIQVLERWSPIESSEVAQHLANIFAVDEQEIKRNVINDLKFLRDEGEVTSLYYDKHGHLISKEVEPDDVFYRVKWQLKGQEEEQVSGALETARFDTYIEADPSLINQVQIRQGLGSSLSSPSEDNFTLYFEINHEIYHLSLPKRPMALGGTPSLGLALCRSKPQYPKTMKADFEILKSSYPEVPFVLISFNEPFISSFETEAPLTLLFTGTNKVTFLNESNKNPVETLEVPSGQAQNLLQYLNFFRDKTQTKHWTDIKKEEGRDYRTGNMIDSTLPILFRLKSTSGFLLK